MTRPAPIRASDAGVTLVEVLVVLVLVGVMASTVALSIGTGDRTATLDREAVLLKSRLDRAAERALTEGTTAALLWDTDGYRFAEYAGDGWGAHGSPLLAEEHDLPGGVSLASGSAARGSVLIAPDLLPAFGKGVGAVRMDFRGEGAAVRSVVFDGASASLSAPTP